jgi:hypothetical protein
MTGRLTLREKQHFGKTVWSLCATEPVLHGETGLFGTEKRPFYTKAAPGRRSVLFIDEAYTGTVHNCGRFVDREWFEALQLRDVTWDQFCAGSNILTTTAGMALGLLPLPARTARA